MYDLWGNLGKWLQYKQALVQQWVGDCEVLALYYSVTIEEYVDIYRAVAVAAVDTLFCAPQATLYLLCGF